MEAGEVRREFAYRKRELLRFPIALHPFYSADDSGPVLTSPTNRTGVGFRLRFRRPAPFARASEASRNVRPRYWWFPRLYQERSTLTGARHAVKLGLSHWHNGT